MDELAKKRFGQLAKQFPDEDVLSIMNKNELVGQERQSVLAPFLQVKHAESHLLQVLESASPYIPELHEVAQELFNRKELLLHMAQD